MRTLGSFNHPGPMKSRSRSCSPAAHCGSGARDPTIGDPLRVRRPGQVIPLGTVEGYSVALIQGAQRSCASRTMARGDGGARGHPSRRARFGSLLRMRFRYGASPKSARSSRAPSPASRRDARRASRNPARRRRAPAGRAAPARPPSDRTARQAQPQDLRQVVIEPHRRPQHVGILRRQQAEPPRLVEHAGGRGVEDFRLLGGVHELQILRDELEIDQPAGGIFQIPARRLSPFSLAIACRISATSAGNRSPDRARGRARRGSPPRPAPRTPAAPRHHARARQRHVLPGPGFGLLIAREASMLVATGPERPDGRSRMST